MATQKKIRRYNEDFIKYGFSVILKNSVQQPQCVICAKVLSAEALKPCLLKRHLNGCHADLKNKDVNYFKRMESILQRTRLDNSGAFQQSTKAAVHASYIVSLRIAQQKKPHSIAETLILPCCKDIINIMLGEQHVNKLNNISLSDNTVQRRISDMAQDIKEQVISEIKLGLGLFTLQLDETTDVANCSQLLVFVRYVRDNNFKEEFLFCQDLEATTTGEDVFNMVNSFFEIHGLEWKNLCGCTTDGAPAMIGCRSGFQSKVIEKNSSAKNLHCMLHRQALASKTLPSELKEILNKTIKMVNFIKSSALNTRLFRLLCADLDAAHESLLYHTEVRWLSRGNVVKRVYELQEEMKVFFTHTNKPETNIYLDDLNDPIFLDKLSYLVDIFTRLNILNKSMQGSDVTVVDFIGKLNSFAMKLDLWKSKVEKGNFAMFETLSERGDISKSLKLSDLIAKHLLALRNELGRYFPELTVENANVIRNPFIIPPESVDENLQEELIDLFNDSRAHSIFERESLTSFWCQMTVSYPGVAIQVIKMLLLFPSTYLCESGFSSLLLIKSKMRARLAVEADLRCALSKTEPRISQLVAQIQHQPSH